MQIGLRSLCVLAFIFGELVLSGTNSYGQTMLGDDQVTLDILHSSLGGGFSTQPYRGFRDESGGVSIRSAGATMNLPVFESTSRESGNTERSMVLFQANASVLQPSISFLPEQHTLYASSVGATYRLFTGDRTAYALTGHIGFAEDENTIHDARVRFTGSGLGTSHLSENSFFIYGLAYSYTFDRSRLFPIVGIAWQFESEWSVHALLPTSVQIKHHSSDNITLGMGIQIHGNRFRFSDAQFSGGQSEVLNLRLTELQLDGRIYWKLNKEFILIAETGVAAGRTLSITSNSRDLFTSGIKPAPFLSLMLRYRFGGSVQSIDDE